MVYVAQLVVALDCESRGRQFEPAHTHHNALVMELVVMAVLETVAERCEGSTPSQGTNAPVAQMDEHFATNEEDRSSTLFRCTNAPFV